MVEYVPIWTDHQTSEPSSSLCLALPFRGCVNRTVIGMHRVSNNYRLCFFPLFYLKKTNSVPIITNNGVCLRVWAVYLNTKRGSKDRFCLTTENVCTCVRMCITTTKHECVCVYLLGGCIYSPFSCCYDSPVSHRPERRADLRKSGTPLCHFTVRHGARQVGCVTSSLRESYSRWHRSQRVLDNEKDDSNSLMCHGQYET